VAVIRAALFLGVLLGAAAAAPQQASLRGRIRDAEGKPIAGARVGALDQETAALREALTDADGRFEVAGLDTGRRYRLVVSKFGYESVARPDVRAGATELDIALARKPGVALAPEQGKHEPRTIEPVPASQAPTFKVAVDLVLTTVSVRDTSGNPVPNLTAANFALFEDGKPVPIVHFQEETSPASIMLLIDTSSSMEGTPLQEAQRAAREFLDRTGGANEIALLAFNERVTTVAPFAERTAVRSAVDGLRASGGTALYDAIARAIEGMRGARHRRRAIVVLSDGKDEDSSSRYGALERLIQSSDVVVFSIGEYAESDRKLFATGNKFYKEPQVEANLNPVWVLRSVAQVSGGEAFFPRSGEPLTPLFSRIARELNHQYVLGFTPQAPSDKPSFHTIEVRVQGTSLPGTVIRARKGYRTSGTE
jgi:Ca-activated chloride channel family protein